jgi:hypothetical protein
MTKLRQPILSRELAPTELATLDGADLERVRVDGCALAKQRGDRVRFEGVRLVGGELSESKVAALAWIDARRRFASSA